MKGLPPAHMRVCLCLLCGRWCWNCKANWLPEGYSHRCKLYSDLNPMNARQWNAGDETKEEAKVRLHASTC